MIETIDQLTEIYLNEESFHKKKLDRKETEKYFKKIIEKGNLATYTNREGMVIGYTEWFCVSYEQYRRLIDDAEFHIGEENINDGPICYVNDVWIDRRYRDGKVFNNLKRQMFKATKECLYYCGHEQKRNRLIIRRKKHGN